MKHLISIEDLEVEQLGRLLDLTDHMMEINSRSTPKVPALRGRTVASVFFEDSTRTRLSFETAAKRLSADVMTFNVGTSSVNKGESLRDTIETLSAMGVDAFVIRHKSSGVPRCITQWTDAAVLNAGDGWHQHPTQALLDCHTITRSLGTGNDLSGVAIAIVGDVRHSRVARSDVQAFAMMGASITLVAPPTLLPGDVVSWPVKVAGNIDEVISTTDVVYMLRMQRERMDSAFVPSLAEYSNRFALTPERALALRSEALVLHPGPMNRGVEMVVDPSDLAQSRILLQVKTGVAARMAALFTLLQVEGEDLNQGGVSS